MSKHRQDKNINELKKHFNIVIDWVSCVFIDVEKEMRGLEWGRLYEEYHKKSYNPAKVSAEGDKLYGDFFVKDKKGIFEYVLGGVITIQNSLMSAFLTNPPKELYVKSRLAKLKPKRNQIVHSAQSGMMLTRTRFGVLPKWKLIVFQHGVKAAKQHPKTAKCCVRHIIGQKVIDKACLDNRITQP